MKKYTLNEIIDLKYQIRVASISQATQIAAANGYTGWTPNSDGGIFYIMFTRRGTCPIWTKDATFFIKDYDRYDTIDFNAVILSDKISGYVPKTPELAEAARNVLGCLSTVSFVNNKAAIEKFRHLGVLDLWFDHVVKEELPEILGYTPVITKDEVKYGCQVFTETELKMLLDMMNKNKNPQIKIEVGSSEYVLTPKLIQTAINTLKS